jgi:hypothetical protein
MIADAGDKYKVEVLVGRYDIAQAGKKHPNHKEITVLSRNLLAILK